MPNTWHKSVLLDTWRISYILRENLKNVILSFDPRKKIHFPFGKFRAFSKLFYKHLEEKRKYSPV